MSGQKPDPIVSNARLFGLYTNKFSNFAQFAHFANKFKDWLSDDRAYYELARPEIIRILEHACRTLQTSNVPAETRNSCKPAYREMVETACKHRAKFTEPELQQRLGALESNLISLDDPTTSAQPPVSSTVSVISDTPQPEPAPQTASALSPAPSLTTTIDHEVTSTHPSMSPSVEETAKRKAPTGPTKSRKRKKVDYTKFTQIDMAGISAPNSPPLPEHESDSNKAIPTSRIDSSQHVQPSDVAKTSTNIPASGDETESDQIPLQAPSVTIFGKKQPFQTGIENTDIKTAPRVGDLFSSPSLRNQGLNSFVINKTESTIQPTTLPSEAHTEPDVPKHQPSHNQPFVAEITPEKTEQGGVDTQEEAEPSPENLMMSPNDSSGVEIVDLPESTNSPSESDTGNQPLSTSSLLDAQFQAPHELRSDVVHRTTALVLKDAPDDMSVSKSGPEPELEPESALAPSEPLLVANEHEFPSITPTRKEMEEIPDSELSQINQTNAVLSPVPTTTNASESTTAPLVQMRMGEHPGTESSQTAQMDGECADAEAVVPPPEPVPRGSASAEPAFVANGTEPAMVSQIEMEVENEAEDGHNSKDLEVEPPQTAHNASTGALNTVSQIVIPPPEPVPREPIKLETSSHLRKAQSARFEFHKAIDEGRREVKPEEIIVPSFEGFTHHLRILSFTGGASDKATHHFTVRVSQTQLETIKTWNNRRNNPLAVERNKQPSCISLACYRKRDLTEEKIKQHSSFQYQLFNDVKPAWPRNKKLSLQVNFNGKPGCFPMAPPLSTTPEDLFELGPYLREGDNIIELIVEDDMSNYVFCLLSHHPTRRQKEQLRESVRKDWSWRIFLDDIVRPLEVQPSFFGSAQ